ncbi:MAG: glycerol-3-phosphate 1-O-acyltransferase PlsY [Candidatus Omnitrophota bacterium]
MQWTITGIIVSYLIGSVPTAYIFGRIFKGIDIRKFGSGNVGATNALRVLGRGPGITVLAVDMLKGLLAVTVLAGLLTVHVSAISAEALRIILGLACILGHNWTVFLKFRGGKGVATTLGVLIGLSLSIPGLKFVVAASIAIWLLVYLTTKIISAASLATALTLPLSMVFFRQSPALVSLGVFLSLFVILRHKSNLKRLIQGKEPKTHFKR